MLFWKIIYNCIVLPFFLILILPGRFIFPKIRRSLREHKGLWERSARALSERNKKKKLIWIHAASAGEYLQGKPLIEEFKKLGCDCFLTLTSVSGYRWVRQEKNKDLLHFDYYPIDLPFLAKKFLDMVQPDAILFIKTDLWPNLIWNAQKKGIPLFLTSATLSEASGKYASFYIRSYYLSLINNMTEIMTVEEEDRNLFQKIVNENVLVNNMGDSRYESVVRRKKDSLKHKLPFNANTIIFGSLRKAEFDIVLPVLAEILEKKPKINAIVAPHETEEETIERLEAMLRSFESVRFSELSAKKKSPGKCRVVIVDTVGNLFSLYQNAFIAYVGGGFSSGIHNVLEPGVWGLPTIIGPRFYKFREVIGMVEEQCVIPVESPFELQDALDGLMRNTAKREKLGKSAKTYIEKRSKVSKDITKKVLSQINH